jgi:hypothetical protein
MGSYFLRLVLASAFPSDPEWTALGVSISARTLGHTHTRTVRKLVLRASLHLMIHQPVELFH